MNKVTKLTFVLLGYGTLGLGIGIIAVSKWAEYLYSPVGSLGRIIFVTSLVFLYLALAYVFAEVIMDVMDS